MKTLGRSTAVLLSMLLASVSFGIVGCEQDGPIENAGEEIGEAMDDVGDEIEDVVDDADDEIEDVADEVTDKK